MFHMTTCNRSTFLCSSALVFIFLNLVSCNREASVRLNYASISESSLVSEVERQSGLKVVFSERAKKIGFSESTYIDVEFHGDPILLLQSIFSIRGLYVVREGDLLRVLPKSFEK